MSTKEAYSPPKTLSTYFNQKLMSSDFVEFKKWRLHNCGNITEATAHYSNNLSKKKEKKKKQLEMKCADCNTTEATTRLQQCPLFVLKSVSSFYLLSFKDPVKKKKNVSDI